MRAMSKDDQWIIEHEAELKAELLRLAKEGAPRPLKGTLLARALELFTVRGRKDVADDRSGER
jgi:hypothetical protein